MTPAMESSFPSSPNFSRQNQPQRARAFTFHTQENPTPIGGDTLEVGATLTNGSSTAHANGNVSNGVNGSAKNLINVGGGTINHHQEGTSNGSGGGVGAAASHDGLAACLAELTATVPDFPVLGEKASALLVRELGGFTLLNISRCPSAVSP